jgi:hypothetical protein
MLTGVLLGVLLVGCSKVGSTVSPAAQPSPEPTIFDGVLDARVSGTVRCPACSAKSGYVWLIHVLEAGGKRSEVRIDKVDVSIGETFQAQIEDFWWSQTLYPGEVGEEFVKVEVNVEGCGAASREMNTASAPIESGWLSARFGDIELECESPPR